MGNGLEIVSSTINAEGQNSRISLNGSSSVKTGTLVTGSNFSAGAMDIQGVATQSGTGFSFRTSHFNDALAGLKTVTFSSAGSSAGVWNVLDSNIVTMDNLDTLLAWHPDNITQIGMGGASIFDDSNKTDKGWVADFSSDSIPNGGWVFDNTTVTAAGAVDLKGAGFTNSTIVVSDGDLRLANTGQVILNGDTITVSNGGADVHSQSGSINLKGSNVTAKNDINVVADNGSVTVAGQSNDLVSSISSSEGNISVKGDVTNSGQKDGVLLQSVSLSSTKGNINVTGMTANQRSDIDTAAGVKFMGNVSLSSEHNTVEGKNVAQLAYGEAAGITLFEQASVVFTGDTDIKADSEGDPGIRFKAGFSAGGQSVEFRNGIATIHAVDKGILKPGVSYVDDLGGMAINAATGVTRKIEFKVSDAILNIISESLGVSHGGLVSYGNSGGGPNEKARGSGYIFTGVGDINIKGVSEKGNGVDLRVLNNKDLTGKFTVTGESDSGIGVIVPEFADVDVVNATISGNSKNGVGIMINAEDKNTRKVNLQGNSLNGHSASGSSGVQIQGKNVSITNGTIAGTVDNGSGAGVILSGKTDYVISGAEVTGKAVDGVGVSVSGNLTVNDNASIAGTASGEGAAGVKVSGNLNSTGGSSIHGTALFGDGVQISGGSSLAGVTLSGETETGTGVNIAGNLQTDENTTVTGKATDTGTGVILGGTLEGGKISGTSVGGTGLQLADNTTVASSVLSGISTSGDGVTVTGNTVLDDTSARKLNAASGSGNGLSLKDGADISIVHLSQSEQQKTDADGNLVTDESGEPVMETVTTTAPVSAPVTMTGTSGTGSGVATSGNVSVSGVTLSGKTSTDNGTGVTLGGHLVFADDISGISADATGNGTALKISDGVIDAKGYTDAGKTLVIRATSEDAAAVSISGNSSLISVELGGAASGNGNGVVVSGSLFTDKALTAVSEGDKGMALQLSGGHLQSTAADNAPVKVVASATGSGTAVAVTQPEGDQSGSGLSGINLDASADQGTVLDIAGNLSMDRDISVSTENGTAISLHGGSLQGAGGDHPVTVIAQATGDGSAVTVRPSAEGAPENTLANITLNTTSARGDALNVGGVLNTKGVTVVAATTETGTALNVSGGEIHSQGGTGITATSDSGHATVLNDGKLTGDSAGALTVAATTTADTPALSISGTSDISNSVVSGENSGKGSAVSVAGILTSSGGGEIKGQTVNGTAVEIKDGASATSSQEGGLLITATATGEKGAGVVLSNAILTGSRINADATQGSAVTIMDGSITGGNIAGHATEGTGVNVAGKATLTNASLSGTTQTGTGAVINGVLTSDEASQVTGTATQDGGEGVSLKGSVTGGKVEGHATSGDAVTVADGSSVADAAVKGDAASGTGVNVAGKATLTNASLSGTTQTGTGAVINGVLTSDEASQVTGTATQDGGEGVSLKGSVTGGKVEGHATSGDAVTVADGSSVADAAVKGDAASGTGVNVAGKATLTNATVSGDAVTGTGVHVKGDLVNNGSTTVTGTSSGNGTGTLLSGDVAGGVVNGHSTDGVGVSTDRNVTLADVAVNGTSVSYSGVLVNSHVTNTGSAVITGSSESGDGVSLNGTVSGGGLKGHSVSGAGLHITGDSQLNGVDVSSSSEHGQDVLVDGNSPSADSSLNEPGLQDTARQVVYQQHGVISHTESQGHPVMTSGYRGQDKPVSVEICTDGQCRKLDAGSLLRPAQ
ncbi:beta strand repeat-containing protein [Salmonella enterica]|uniref:beta strand repeat-containing protein n=1 Tax=Salmonella enterica TaxID=28901 RepID=UPI0039181E9D